MGLILLYSVSVNVLEVICLSKIPKVIYAFTHVYNNSEHNADTKQNVFFCQIVIFEDAAETCSLNIRGNLTNVFFFLFRFILHHLVF